MSKKQCPECKSKNVILITYGYLDGSPEVMQKLENEEIYSGGCLIGDDSPKWKCRDCDKEFGKLENI